MLLCAARCGRVSAARWFAAADRLTPRRASIWMLAAPRRLNATLTTLCGSILLPGAFGRFLRDGEGRAMPLCAKRRRRVAMVWWFAAADWLTPRRASIGTLTTLCGLIRLRGVLGRLFSRGGRDCRRMVYCAER
jgi:hypothetical protein